MACRFTWNGKTYDQDGLAKALREMPIEQAKKYVPGLDNVGVPDSPFIKNTGAWVELALKRMIRMAAEEGKSRISWTPGEAQAARYDLSKSYKTINAVKKKDGSYMIQGQPAAYEASPMQRLADNVPSDKLVDYVGKDLAEKITDQGGGKFEGVDLKVGGEGMKGFYDQMLPKMAEKLGKQYGVKVKTGHTVVSRVDPEMPTAKQVARQPVWYFDIPEKMKRDALTKGFPLFSDTFHGGLVNQENNDKNQIERPEQKEEKARAKGGRVVASNIAHEPTEAQKSAGNYAKDHVSIQGLDLTIENAKGKERSGIGKDGKRWKVKMPAHYGYVKRTEGKDGDHVDIYLGHHTKSKLVFVINQVDADTRRFDEHKCFIGFRNLQHAVDTYQKAFSDGKALQRIGSIVPCTMEQFKHWLKTGNTKKPFADNALN